MGACFSKDVLITINKNKHNWIIQFDLNPIMTISIPFFLIYDEDVIENIQVDIAALKNKQFDKHMVVTTNKRNYVFMLDKIESVIDKELKRIYIGDVVYLNNKIGKIYNDLL